MGKWKIRIDHFGNENTIRGTVARMVNVLSGSEIDKITVGNCGGVENYITWKKSQKLRK